MNDNPYAAPATTIAADAPSDVDQDFYVVAPVKYWLLTLLTFGLYHLAWAYQQWRHLKRRVLPDIWPVPRAIFLIFFLHQLMRLTREKSQERGVNQGFGFANAATLAVVLFIASQLIDRVSGKLDLIWLQFGSLLLIPVLGHAVWRMQAAINRACGDPTGASNARFSTTNWIWMVLGAVLTLFVIFGVAVAILHPDALVEAHAE
jgi:hypothetical protein